MRKKEVGDFGETLALIHLTRKNITILEKNFRLRTGEIDIIGLSQNYLIFYEVKTRKSSSFGTPGECINRDKIKKIKKTALFFISSRNLFNYDVSFDVIEVYLNADSNLSRINIIENAF